MATKKTLKPLKQLKFDTIGEEYIFLYEILYSKKIIETVKSNEETPTIEEMRQEYNFLVNQADIVSKYPKTSIYWSEVQEKAIVEYIKEKSSKKKNEIFRTHLYKPFKKLIENIIFTYKLFRVDIDVIELQNDCMSFLITKIKKFNPANGTKAFAYFGTIAKHYLMGEKKNRYKMTKSTIDIEENADDISRKNFYTPEEEEKNSQTHQIFNKIIKVLEHEIQQPKMLTNDKKVGEAIIWIFQNHDILNVYNKNLVYHLLKERTCLQTKEITYSLGRLKQFYRVFKEEFLKKEPLYIKKWEKDFFEKNK